MAELLYRIGRSAAGHARWVLATWVLIVVAAGGAYLTWGGTLTNSVTIPGTPTQEVTDLLQQEFPDAAGGTGTVVFATTDGTALTPAQRSEISTALAQVTAVDGVADVVDPFATEAQREAQREALAQQRTEAAEGLAGLDAQQAALDALETPQPEQQAALDAARAQLEASAPVLDAAEGLLAASDAIRTVSEDGSAALGTVIFQVPAIEVEADTKDTVSDLLSSAEIDGVQVALLSDLTMTIPAIGGISEILGVAIAGVVLFIMLGTLIAAGLPVLTALIGVAVGALGSLALSGAVQMISVTPILGVMLGLAVGIDYSLFILNRHRRQLLEGASLHESIGLANGTSGNAVVFAGSTVIIALLALNLTGIPFLGLMGSVGAACVFIAVLVAITLTPALLGLAGDRLLPARVRSQPRVRVDRVRRPMSSASAWLRVLAGLIALGIIALPSLSMRLGLPDGTGEPEDSTQYRAYTLTEREFGEGANGPLVVVVSFPQAPVPTGLDEEQTQAATTMVQASVTADLMAQTDVVASAPVGFSEDGTLAVFQVLPSGGPNAESTADLVHNLRDLELSEYPQASLGVAGFASGNIDVSEKLADALPLYLLVVVGLSILILVVVFRSLLVPILATGGFVLSLFAALGGVTAIYQWGWLGPLFGVHDPGPILSFLPIVLTGVLFGLAMDYQIFLTSGMRESYVHGLSAREAVAAGLTAGRAVVTAAAIIMASVFGGFVFSEATMIRPIGFALAFGVLLDAFVVRMLIMPGVMHLAGRAAWWLPGWLRRVLPDVDIEGARLERRHHAIEANAGEVGAAEAATGGVGPDRAGQKSQ